MTHYKGSVGFLKGLQKDTGTYPNLVLRKEAEERNCGFWRSHNYREQLSDEDGGLTVITLTEDSYVLVRYCEAFLYCFFNLPEWQVAVC